MIANATNPIEEELHARTFHQVSRVDPESREPAIDPESPAKAKAPKVDRKVEFAATQEMSTNREIHEFAGGEICFWIEQETIHLETTREGRHGDPVELTENEAKRLATALLKSVEQIEALNS